MVGAVVVVGAVGIVVVGAWVDEAATTATVAGTVVVAASDPAKKTFDGIANTAAVAPPLCRYSITTDRTPAVANDVVALTVRSEAFVQTLSTWTPSTKTRARSSIAMESTVAPAGKYRSAVHRAVKLVERGPQYVVLYSDVR